MALEAKIINQQLVVQKYGGTSVGTIDRIKHVAKHIARTVAEGKQVVAVISAMGDQTDELLAMAHQISSHPPRRELDMLLTAGERISMALVSIALNELKMKAVSLTGSQSGIITDTVHGNARISRIGAHRIQENLATGNIVIVAGFQGVSAESKEITTLGRGGSDLSAIALAGALGAGRCQLYKDVDGICTADPRIVKDAKLIKTLSWDTVNEMAWAGASVLHPRGAHLAAKFQIPVEIRSSFHLDREGTLVCGRSQMEQYEVQSVTHKTKMAIVKGLAAKNADGWFNEARMWLWQNGETPQFQSQYAHDKGVEFCWSMPLALSAEFCQRFSSAQKTQPQPMVAECDILTVIGSGFWQSPEMLEKVHKLIPEIKLLDIKNTTVTIAIDKSQLNNSIEALVKNLVTI